MLLFLVFYRIENATRFEAVHFREKQTETEKHENSHPPVHPPAQTNPNFFD